MEKLIFLALFVVCANCYYIDNGTTSKEKIVKEKYVDISTVPSLAQLLMGKSLKCGATIISPHWLLSAAHCVVDIETSKLSITTGSSDQGIGEKHRIRNIIVHRYYDNHTFDNDISLIRVRNAIIFNKNQSSVKIAKVPPKFGQMVKFSGFGNAATHAKSLPHLRTGRAFASARYDCVNYFDREYQKITKNMFCAVSPKDDSCKVDSGGPVFRGKRLVGVLSWSNGCEKGLPRVYTKVANYIDWINAETGLYLYS